ncbi:5'-methylthioadenosine/S-adenosylhomocysteine nucleosidase [Acinetobacter sp. WZC-1]|uniref:5'-methylthioadenosine/S-adenosylhomocysteine nucleosidase n=1 Tax=Acinetobacter sp. WZC-1 TaxID=3459034 RepID=UPI00403E3613
MHLFKLSLLVLCAAVPAIYLTACKSSSAEASQPDNRTSHLTDDTPRLGIIAAFGQEADLLIQSTEHRKQYIINGRKFITGQLENTDVVITLSGISMTNAAMTTQMMTDHFQLKGLVFSGIAGSLNPDLQVGDVVIARSWIAPNEVYYAANQELPDACGKAGDISCLGLKLDETIPAYGTQFFRQTNVINANNYQEVALSTQDDHGETPVAYGEMKTDFPVDAKMLSIASKVQHDTQRHLEAICQTSNDCYQPKIIMGQRGVSGGAFLANTEYRNYLHQQMAGDVVDMETAAVAQVAYSNSIPFIAFRSLSDLAGADHDPNVAAFFSSGVAQRNAARLTMNFIQEWTATN